MASIKDDRGYNQGFAPGRSTTVRMDRRANWLLSEMKIQPGIRILEIGCGTGEISHWLAKHSEAQVIGTDLCIPFIEEAKKKHQLPNLRFEVADFSNPNVFAGEHFDYIVGNGILHHLYDGLADATLGMYRLLKDDGKILFIEPNIYNPYIYLIFSFSWLRTIAHLEPDETAFSKSYITDLLKKAGFKNIQVDYKDFLLPGIPEVLIRPSIWAGDFFEKIPLIKMMSQSIFIRAKRPDNTLKDMSNSIFTRESFRMHRARFLFLARYTVSALLGSAIQILFLYVWVSVLALASLYLLGLALGFILALLVTFLLQKHWALRDRTKDQTRLQFLSYSAVALSGLALNALLLALAKAFFEASSVNFFDGWYLLAQIVIVGVVSVTNFSLNYLITFREARRERSWEQ